MKTPDLKKLIPYVGAILFFVVIIFVYFSPLLEGKQIIQSDIINFKGVSKEISDYREKTGQEPLWTNALFGGMPAYQVSTKYTANLVGWLDKILTLGLPHPANLVFLYFLGFFILLLVMDMGIWLSIAGATAFAFSSYFFIIIEAGHNSKAHAIAYMAPVIAGIILTMKRKYIWGGILTALFLSLEIKANHPQITYYLGIIAILLGVFELVQSIRVKTLKPFFKAVAILVIAASFAFITNITSLWATWEYGKYTIRGKSELSVNQSDKTSGLDKSYATQWSYGIGETMTLMIPDFYGGSSNREVGPKSKMAESMRSNGIPEETITQFTSQPLPFIYWGDQPFTSGPVYVGAIVMFLFVLGLLIVKGPLKWWLLTATVLSVMLAWGHNFMAFTDFFLEYIPGYNKFRAVTMILVIAEFAIPLLGMLALKEIADGKQERKKIWNNLLIAAGITAGTCLFFIAFPSMFLSFAGPGDANIMRQYQFPDWLMQAIRDDRLRLMRNDSLRSMIFIILSGVLLWAFVFKKIRKEYAFIAITILIIADLFPVNKRYFNNDAFTSPSRVATPFEPNAANLEILKDNDPNFRVLNLTTNTFNDASTSYFHKSIGGYHGAKLRRYQELIDHGIQDDITTFAGSISTDSTPVLNMLNTKYLILPDNEKQPSAFPNNNALGHAWFVEGYLLAENADREIAMMKGFRPDSVAIVNALFADFLKDVATVSDSSDAISLNSYQPNALSYTYKTSANRLAVFSEIWYPKGWNAYIDGNLTPHFRANYVLRSMVLPAGEHTLEFRFEPQVFIVGEKISFASSLLLIIIILALAGSELWKLRRRGA